MKPLDEHPELGQTLRAMRILVRTIAAGLAIFLGVVAYLHYGQGQDTPPENAGLLTNVALAVAGLLVVGSGMVRTLMMRKALAAWAEGDIRGFQQRYTAAVIAAAAMIEGAGFLLATAFLVEKNVMALTAGVLCLLVLLAAVPTRGKLNMLLEMTR